MPQRPVAHRLDLRGRQGCARDSCAADSSGVPPREFTLARGRISTPPAPPRCASWVFSSPPPDVAGEPGSAGCMAARPGRGDGRPERGPRRRMRHREDGVAEGGRRTSRDPLRADVGVLRRAWRRIAAPTLHARDSRHGGSNGHSRCVIGSPLPAPHRRRDRQRNARRGTSLYAARLRTAGDARSARHRVARVGPHARASLSSPRGEQRNRGDVRRGAPHGAMRRTAVERVARTAPSGRMTVLTLQRRSHPRTARAAGGAIVHVGGGPRSVGQPRGPGRPSQRRAIASRPRW